MAGWGEGSSSFRSFRSWRARVASLRRAAPQELRRVDVRAAKTQPIAKLPEGVHWLASPRDGKTVFIVHGPADGIDRVDVTTGKVTGHWSR